TTSQLKYETVTNTNGELSFPFQTTTNMTEICITAFYEGSIDKVNAQSSSKITVNPYVPPTPPPSSSPPPLPPPSSLKWSLMSTITATIATTATFGYILRKKQKIRIEQEKLVREYELILELDSLESLLVVEKKSGLCLFEYPFKGTAVEPNLIAGFIQAIRGFYMEIGGMGEGEVGEIYYEMPEPKVLTFHSGRYVYPILIAPGKLLPEVKDCLRNFLDKFEEEFETVLEMRTPEVSIFDKAREIVAECFPKEMFTRYKVAEKVQNIGKIEKKVLKIAKEVEKDEGSFTIAQLLTETAKREKIDPVKALKALKVLLTKKALQPTQEPTDISIQTSTIPISDHSIQTEKSKHRLNLTKNQFPKT
ncbi:MAG: hypothetical protein ACTSV7_12450, partial [Candidatus Baldrarchaeia archaeon]